MSRKSSSGSESLETCSDKIEQNHDVIHEFAATGDVHSLRLEISRNKGSLEARTSDKDTPLIIATTNCHLQCIQLLVTSGADIDANNNEGRTPVAIAARQGWYDGMYYLITMGADCNLADNYGRLPVHIATYHSTERALEVLLNNISLEDTNKGDNEGMTALHWGAFHNRDGHVKLLIEKGAEVLVRDTAGKTPLHLAAQNGSLESTEVLLSSRGSQHLVNGKDFSGKSPLHLAAAAGHRKVLERLTREEHAQVDLQDNDSRTPLHWAAATGQSQCVAVLLRLGADKDYQDRQAATPLMYAQQSNHSRCCRLLMNHDPNNPFNTKVPSEEKTHQDTRDKEEIGIDHNLRSRRSTAPAIIAEQERGLTIDFCSENLPISASIPINLNEADTILGDKGNNLDTEVVETLNGTQQRLELTLDEDLISGFSLTDPEIVNGLLSSSDESDFSSDDESRYLPQMVLTPIPCSPVPPHEVDSSEEEARPPIPPRFSFEGQKPLDKPATATSVELGPLKAKTIPDHLRLNISFSSGTSKPVDIKPAAAPVGRESPLAPLKVKLKPNAPSGCKQSTSSMTGTDVVDSNRQRSTLSAKRSNSMTNHRDSVESLEFNKQWNNIRVNKKPDLLLLSPTSDIEPDLIRRPSREKKYSAGSFVQNNGGQMFPVISSVKSNSVNQLQGSLQDQIDSMRKVRKESVPQCRSTSEDLTSLSVQNTDQGKEETRVARFLDKRIPNTKRKVRKVMSWNT